MLPAGVAHSVRVPHGRARLLYVTIGAPYDGMARELSALYASGQVTLEGVVAIANRHGVRLEGDVDASTCWWGILVGTGPWVGWSEALRLGIPKEVHIHASRWCFASLVFAGLLVDLLPALTSAALASRRTLTTIFWAMTLGALGLVLSPWLSGNLFVMVPGLVLHITATVWLLTLMVRGLRRAGLFASAGARHLALSYVWILLPVPVAPLIILGVSGIPGADVEATAQQLLIHVLKQRPVETVVGGLAIKQRAEGQRPARYRANSTKSVTKRQPGGRL
jgi:hypothetical protein